MTTTDARKRNRDMADAHETARARDARAIYDEVGEQADHSDCPWCVAMNDYIDAANPIDQETDMTKPSRIEKLLEATLEVARDIRDRLPERECVNRDAGKEEYDALPQWERDLLEAGEPTDITEEPPVGTRLVDRDGDVWERREDGWYLWVTLNPHWSICGSEWRMVRHHSPLHLVTPVDLERAGLTELSVNVSEDAEKSSEPAPADDPDEEYGHDWKRLYFDWSERAIKAEANLARVTEERDLAKSHLNDDEHATVRRDDLAWALVAADTVWRLQGADPYHGRRLRLREALGAGDDAQVQS